MCVFTAMRPNSDCQTLYLELANYKYSRSESLSTGCRAFLSTLANCVSISTDILDYF